MSSPTTHNSTAAGVFTDVVFDRPLDHAYSYAVPAHLVEHIGVGKRVEAPFGRGDKTTVGYCVRVHQVPPTRAVKSITRVLDDEALLTDSLLRLTRWMADYYLCGWGQVLQAVLPAGVRDQAGTREAVFVEPVPEAELPQSEPSLTPKQSNALSKLRKTGGPIEQKRLCRDAGVGPGVVRSLIEKGLARKHVERVERTDLPNGLVELPGPITLNADQEKAWAPIQQAVASGG
ncbi:MAG TPA: primosomal protein N', partial [Gemmataceae bacterium]|nr:primosomal protein N' [Gemmataceae bacterium]